MRPLTRQLWEKQDRHEGDRRRLFTAVARACPASSVLYPGSFVDIGPSFAFPSVTYVDVDNRAAKFFSDGAGVAEIIAGHDGSPASPDVRFIHGDYTADLGIGEQSHDLLVSLYAGFVSEHCTRNLRVGGTLLVNASHGDAAMASIDPRYELRGVVISRDGDYRVSNTTLESYFIPKRGISPTKESLRASGRGVAYTKSPFAYLFERVG